MRCAASVRCCAPRSRSSTTSRATSRSLCTPPLVAEPMPVVEDTTDGDSWEDDENTDPGMHRLVG